MQLISCDCQIIVWLLLLYFMPNQQILPQFEYNIKLHHKQNIGNFNTRRALYILLEQPVFQRNAGEIYQYLCHFRGQNLFCTFFTVSYFISSLQGRFVASELQLKFVYSAQHTSRHYRIFTVIFVGPPASVFAQCLKNKCLLVLMFNTFSDFNAFG